VQGAPDAAGGQALLGRGLPRQPGVAVADEFVEFGELRLAVLAPRLASAADFAVAEVVVGIVDLCGGLVSGSFESSRECGKEWGGVRTSLVASDSFAIFRSNSGRVLYPSWFITVICARKIKAGTIKYPRKNFRGVKAPLEDS
jgi:hypothetical protein